MPDINIPFVHLQENAQVMTENLQNELRRSRNLQTKNVQTWCIHWEISMKKNNIVINACNRWLKCIPDHYHA